MNKIRVYSTLKLATLTMQGFGTLECQNFPGSDWLKPVLFIKQTVHRTTNKKNYKFNHKNTINHIA